MNPSTKVAATAFLSSTQSAARAISLHARDYTTAQGRKMVHEINVKDQIVKCFSTSPKSTATSDPNAAMGSSRGRRAIEYLPSYLTDARAVETYDAENCPDGPLQLSVAENQMLEDLLVPAYSKFCVGLNKDEEFSTNLDLLSSHFEPERIYYQPTHGRPDLRRSTAHFLEKMLKLPPSATLCQDNLIMGAGCNAVLENLVFCLADQGDPVLVPTPYYAAFEFDLGSRADVPIIPVETEESYKSVNGKSSPENNSITPVSEAAYYPTPLSLDTAYADALRKTGRKPRILLISHPNNPLGICYPKEVLMDCISWARKNEVHLISDEIYAGSVYKPSNFHSALSLASEYVNEDSTEKLGLGPYIHFVYALSKDFASSGLRVGVAYTENESIIFPLQKLNDLCQISSQTQLIVKKMFESSSSSSSSSEDWASSFLEENQSRIRNRANQLMEVLDEMEVPYLTPDSGLFMWIDLRQFLPEPQDNISTMDLQKAHQERTLYLELMNKHGLLFTPGLSMKNLEPGFFRCVFTAATDSEFALALQRMKKFVEFKRNEA